MAIKRQLIWVLAVAAIGGGAWLLAYRSREKSPKSVTQSVIYSFSNMGNTIMLLDHQDGKTWMLRRDEYGMPTWLPISRIDSEIQTAQLWQRSSDYNNGLSLPIDALLKEREYIGIHLNRLKAGYLGIDMRIEGGKVFLAVDTAAPITHLDLGRVKHLQLKWHPYAKEEAKAKAPATQGDSWCEITKLEIAGLDIGRLVVGGHDLSGINNNLKLYSDPQIDGVLGSDVLAKLNAIIDYSTFNLYIRSSEKRNKTGIEKKNGVGSRSPPRSGAVTAIGGGAADGGRGANGRRRAPCRPSAGPRREKLEKLVSVEWHLKLTY